MSSVRTVLTLAALSTASVGMAQNIFITNMSGLEEVPPNASPGTGTGTVTLNGPENQIQVHVEWSGLTASANAGHIHGPAGPGSTAPPIFNFGAITGTSGTFDSTFAISAAQVADLRAGLYYINIHTANFPGGEIRGQLTAVPEPATLAVLGLGALAALRRRRG